VPIEGIVIDTNVFVAAGFNPRSASARVLAATRDGRFRLIWNTSTRRETEMILVRIPRLDWERFADLFQPEGEFTGPVDPDAFVLIADPDDRKFAALSAAANSLLVTNDNDLLAVSKCNRHRRAYAARLPRTRGKEHLNGVISR
jgi:predicted nucleic acid-binding protein